MIGKKATPGLDTLTTNKRKKKAIKLAGEILSDLRKKTNDDIPLIFYAVTYATGAAVQAYCSLDKKDA